MLPHLVALLLAVWLTAAPQVLGYANPARGNDHIFGPLAGTVALTAVFVATRPLRWLNVPLGGWLLLAPFVLGYAGTTAMWNELLVGAGLIGLACVRGTVSAKLGGGWPALWRPQSALSGEA